MEVACGDKNIQLFRLEDVLVTRIKFVKWIENILDYFEHTLRVMDAMIGVPT